MEGGSFFKQMQNKQKNLKRKLEKIRAKEQRPVSELSEEEQELLRNKSMVEALNSEYERLIANFLSIKDVTVPEPPKAEVRVEVREEDNAAELLKLWVALHFVSIPEVREKYVEQGLPEADLLEVQNLRSEVMGKPGDLMQSVHSSALPVVAARLRESAEQTDSPLARFTRWALQQKVPTPAPDPVLQVHSLPHHSVVRGVEPEPAKAVEVAPEAPAEEQKEESAAPAQPEPAKEEPKEAAKEPVKEEQKEESKGKWAEQDEEEEEQPQKEGEPDDGFVTVGGKPKYRKPVEARGAAPRRRGRGDRRGRRGDRGGQ